MTREELIEAIEEWHNENQKDRSFLFMAQENIGNGKSIASYGIAGEKKSLSIMISNAIDRDNDLIPLIERAIKLSVIASVIKDDNEDNNENEDEEGEK